MSGGEVLIVGAGMAGASLGAALAARGRSVRLIEMEAEPGYHATGRSVAFWTESYGGPGIQPLTSASGPMLSALGVLSPRGAVHVGRAGDRPGAEAFMRAFEGSGVALQRLEGEALRARVPMLRTDWTIGIAEPSCADIDVAALHAHYLAELRRHGGQVLTSARLSSARREGGRWHVDTGRGALSCDILVNAAGAWADMVAERAGVAPLGIVPHRRTVAQIRVTPPASFQGALVLDLGGSFYFKPAPGGRLWLTPHDEVPSPPCDAAPEELAVAEAVARFEAAMDWPVEAVERRWAGLRSFAPDRRPVYGRDPAEPGFFWFVGQGGFGIQTAPAAAIIGAALICGEALDPHLPGVDPGLYDPARLRR